MDMEGILAITFIFGGGSLFLLAISPIGRAIATRIQGGSARLPDDAARQIETSNQAVLEELEQVRHELADMQERLDFTERVIAQRREAPRLAGGADGSAGES